VIILRYFTRELVVATAAISCGLFLIIVGARFSLYLDQAASGDIAPEVVFVILAYRVPQIATLIVPVGFFFAVLIAYGRMYVDSEMVVLSSCGFSKRRLVTYTLLPAGIIAAVVGLMTLYVIPNSEAAADRIIAEQRNRSELEVLPAGRFQQVNDERPFTIYFENFANNRTQIEQIFIAEMADNRAGNGQLSVVTARVGKDERDPTTGHRYLVLQDGHQYVGRPGSLDYQVSSFDSLRQFLKARDPSVARFREEYASTQALLETDHPAYKAELQWRLSIPVLVIVLALLAVPLSYTNPRHGRFLKTVPSLILVMFYLALLLVARNGIEDETMSVYPGLAWVRFITKRPRTSSKSRP